EEAPAKEEPVEEAPAKEEPAPLVFDEQVLVRAETREPRARFRARPVAVWAVGLLVLAIVGVVVATRTAPQASEPTGAPSPVAAQHVAIAAPIGASIADVALTALFRKSGGPPGGGYGLILRAQRPGELDGSNQGGRYYVFEVGDRGQVGAWRREEDHWVDLLA